MGHRGDELAGRFLAFNKEMIAFIENCSDEDWRKVCPGEQWTIGVVARHVAGGHYGALGLAKMIVGGEELPDITMEAIDQGNAQHAQKHADCTKEEVLGLLRKYGTSIAEYIAGLDDAELDRTAHMAVAGGTVSALQFIENIILQSGQEHLTSMRAALAA
jgi:hypothetical protein